MAIKGLFLDPRIWKIDFLASDFWKPEKYGVSVDLHLNAFKIPEMGIEPGYKFVLTTELWEKPLRRTLEFLRKQGLKVFLVAREPVKYGTLIEGMFGSEHFNINGEYYFTPDVVFAAGEKYASIWKDKTKTYITGYPRWDWYLSKTIITREELCKKYGLIDKRKIIFFPSYPPYHYKKENGKDVLVDLFDAREATLRAISEFTKERDDYQFIAKIHPMSMKCYLKGTGKGNEVSGLLKKHLDSPTEWFRVIGDNRMSGDIAKEILFYSDLVIGYNSTMLLESSMLKKPAMQAMLGNCADFVSPGDGVIRTAYSEQELVEFLEEFVKDSSLFVNKQAKDRAREYLHDVDGKACERICEAIKIELK